MGPALGETRELHRERIPWTGNANFWGMQPWPPWQPWRAGRCVSLQNATIAAGSRPYLSGSWKALQINELPMHQKVMWRAGVAFRDSRPCQAPRPCAPSRTPISPIATGSCKPGRSAGTEFACSFQIMRRTDRGVQMSRTITDGCLSRRTFRRFSCAGILPATDRRPAIVQADGPSGRNATLWGMQPWRWRVDQTECGMPGGSVPPLAPECRRARRRRCSTVPHSRTTSARSQPDGSDWLRSPCAHRCCFRRAHSLRREGRPSRSPARPSVSCTWPTGRRRAWRFRGRCGRRPQRADLGVRRHR